MSLLESLQSLSSRIKAQKDSVSTEEATKTAFVLPFISALGYNVFDPSEVTPELDADIGIKKGEKVDYAILQDGKAAILFECKESRANLDHVHASQLFRYFHCTPARVGVLTNGIEWRFFSDLEEPNKMDDKPFLEIDMLDLREQNVAELKRLQKGALDIDALVHAAGDLKYTREIRRVFSENVSNPSEDLVRFFAGQVHEGRLTQRVIEQFTEYTRRAINQYISDRVSDRLRSALTQEAAAVAEVDESTPRGPGESAEEASEKDGVETTPEELQGHLIVTAICSEVVDPERVTMRDVKTYCGVLLDDNNRKPICRLWFNTSQKYIGVFDEEKNEERIPIDSLREIYGQAKKLKETVRRYEQADSED